MLFYDWNQFVNLNKLVYFVFTLTIKQFDNLVF